MRLVCKKALPSIFHWNRAVTALMRMYTITHTRMTGRVAGHLPG